MMTGKFHGKIFPQYVMPLSRRQIRGWRGAGAAMDYFGQKIVKRRWIFSIKGKNRV
jgi:hypothetical protein